MDLAQRALASMLNKLNEEERHISCMSSEYDFYKQDVLATMLMPKVVGFDKGDAIQATNHLLRDEENDNDIGFIITWLNTLDKQLQIKFIFLKPEYRQKGFFTRLINTWKEDKDELGVDTIHLDTKEEGMIRAANKNGFKYVRKCDNGEDLLFTLTL